MNTAKIKELVGIIEFHTAARDWLREVQANGDDGNGRLSLSSRLSLDSAGLHGHRKLNEILQGRMPNIIMEACSDCTLQIHLAENELIVAVMGCAGPSTAEIPAQKDDNDGVMAC